MRYVCAFSFSIKTYITLYCATRSIELAKKARLLFEQDGAFFSSKQTEMAQRYYAYAISPLDNYE